MFESSRETIKSIEFSRGHWTNKIDFMFSCIGLSVGLGNLWRFPTLAYQYGGATFFIPYIALQLLIGYPMYFFELALGQYTAQGPMGVFRLNPAAKGVGVTMIIVTVVVGTYYNVIVAYVLNFLFASMQGHLPWTTCRPEWISQNCYVRIGNGKSMPKCGINTTFNYSKLCKCSGNPMFDYNISSCPTANSGMNYAQLLKTSETCSRLLICTNQTHTPAHFYFYKHVIQLVDDVSNIGQPIWYLSLCLLLSWAITILCLVRGVKTSGKVVYFTATFPYAVMLTLLIKGATLSGSLNGIRYFLVPTWSELANIHVWSAAGGQVFFSLCVSFGSIITFGSYNKFDNNVYTDSLILCSFDLFTSFLSGLVVFSILGAMAHDIGLEVTNVVNSHYYGLFFVAYPEALSRFAVPQVWCVAFFFMTFTLGIDSELAIMQTILTAICDVYPRLTKHKLTCCLVSGSIMFIFALPMITPGGNTIMNFADQYIANTILFLICFCELVSIMWVYGARRFLGDIEHMLGYKPRPVFFWAATWVVIAPALLTIIFIMRLVDYKPLTYNDGKPINWWAGMIAWLLAVSALAPIPTFFLWSLYKSKGETLLKKLVNASRPTPEWQAQTR